MCICELRLQALASGLDAPLPAGEFAAIQMLDVHFPTHDGRELVFCPLHSTGEDHKMLLSQLVLGNCPRNLHPESPNHANCSRTNSLVQTFDGACFAGTYESIPGQ